MGESNRGDLREERISGLLTTRDTVTNAVLVEQWPTLSVRVKRAGGRQSEMIPGGLPRDSISWSDTSP